MKKLTETINSYIGIRFFLFLTIISCLLGSCTVISKKIDKSLVYDESILELGTTHYRDILELIGPPTKISKYNQGIVFIYESIFIKEKQIGISFNNTILRWFKFSYAWAKADRELLVLIFDNKGYLATQDFNEFNEDLGSGQALTFLISVKSLIDTSHLDENPDSLDWGLSLLKPLPQVLNIPNNLKTGNTGIGQLGTPKNVGQHTLEMDE